MWKLLLTELKYRWIPLLGLAAFAIFFSRNIITGSGEHPISINQPSEVPVDTLAMAAMAPATLIMLLPSLVGALIFLFGENRENRGRLLNSLPLRRSQVSLFRLAFPVLLVALNLLLPLFAMSHTSINGQPVPLFIPLSVAGLLLFLLVLMFWQREMSARRSRMAIRWAAAAAIVIFTLGLQKLAILRFLMLSSYGTATLLAGALILAFSVHRLYLSRPQVYRNRPGA